MTVNSYPKNGTMQHCITYYDSSTTPKKRKQKWIDLEIPIRGNKRWAEELEPVTFLLWQPVLEPGGNTMLLLFKLWPAPIFPAGVYELLPESVKPLLKGPGRRPLPLPLQAVLPPALPVSREPVKEAAPPTPVNPAEPEPEPPKLTPFADVLLDWLQYKKRHIQETTYINYEYAVVGKVEPFYRQRGTFVETMTPDDVIAYYEARSRDGVKGRTVAKHHSYINQALDYAKKQRKLIAVNPALEAAEYKPRIKPFKPEVYNVHDLELLFRYAKEDSLFLVIFIACFYGFRRSEIIGLTWDCVDLHSKTIAIKQAAYMTKRDKDTGTPARQKLKRELKSRSSERVLPLIPEVELALEVACREMAKRKKLFGNGYNKEHQRYVCVDVLGNWIALNYVSQHFHGFLKKHRLKQIRFHDLRHTCATLMRTNNVDLLDIKDWLGHSNVATTELYAHLDYSKHLQTANTVSAAMSFSVNGRQNEAIVAGKTAEVLPTVAKPPVSG